MTRPSANGIATFHEKADFTAGRHSANQVSAPWLHIEGNLSQKTHGLCKRDMTGGTRRLPGRRRNPHHQYGVAPVYVCHEIVHDNYFEIPEARGAIRAGCFSPVAMPVTRPCRSADATRGIILALEQRFSDFADPDARDICYATQNRQSAVTGVTAGALAPEVLVDDVIEALKRIGPVTVSVLPGREENIEFRLPAELTAVD